MNSINARCACAQEGQIPDVSFKESDLYAPVLKSTEIRFLLAVAAANGAKVVKTDANKAICTAMWEMTLSIFDHPIGGQNLFRKGTY